MWQIFIEFLPYAKHQDTMLGKIKKKNILALQSLKFSERARWYSNSHGNKCKIAVVISVSKEVYSLLINKRLHLAKEIKEEVMAET